MNALQQALEDRRRRAIGVREDYEIVPLDLQSYVVQHPDEPDRCYLVDMIERKCSCPDWGCTASGMGIDCKHILGVSDPWANATGERFVRQERGPYRYPGEVIIDSIQKPRGGVLWRIQEKFDRTTCAQIRWMGGEWTRKHGGDGAWYFCPRPATAGALKFFFPRLDTDRCEHFARELGYYQLRLDRGLEEPITEIGYELSERLIHSGLAPSREDLMTWPRSELLLDWIDRQNAEIEATRVHIPEEQKVAPKVVVVGPGYQNAGPDPFARI